ncbi:IS91 family transposase [Pseudomonas syringae]
MKPAYPPLLLQMSPAYTPRPLKNLFTANQCWAHLIEEGGLRDIEVESVTKMLACGTSILGVKHYTCGNDSCPHVKYLCNTCSCRACPSCGKKATDQWIANQQHRLPECTWQHLVFTLPDTLWPLFFHNRHWLDALCRLAVDNLLYAGQRRGVEVGVFCAIHTYGRRLNWHPHIHVSVTLGGIDDAGCRDGYSVRYLRLPRLMEELGLAHGDGRFAKLMAGYAKTDLLILDDWGLAPFTAAQRRDMLELLDDRYGNRSTLVTSQMPVDKWHALIGDPTLGDAILDRLVHNAYRIELKGESMRRRATKLTSAGASD